MASQRVTRDGWDFLRRYTSARIAIGRCGGSLPTVQWLDFKLAHARAKDAVHCPFDPAHLADTIQAGGTETVLVKTLATDRMTYLQRPDLGRRLDDESTNRLCQRADDFDLAIILSDGLSALAVERQTLPLLEWLLPKLRSRNWKCAPIIIAPFARVPLEDEVGALLNARIAMILLGERPGLGSPDSLGAYLVFGPRRGKTDAERNCVSNIRPEGLDPRAAAETLYYLLEQARMRGLSGIRLKDERTVDDIRLCASDAGTALPQRD